MQNIQQSSQANPFMLMLDPDGVLQSIRRSAALGSLRQRTCRPLDRPALRSLSIDLVRVDEEIDREAELDDGAQVPPGLAA